jgi:hypothetical protein
LDLQSWTGSADALRENLKLPDTLCRVKVLNMFLNFNDSTQSRLAGAVRDSREDSGSKFGRVLYRFASQSRDLLAEIEASPSQENPRCTP